ncbi:MAG: GTPase Era [Paralcaligenes sp.]
MSDPFRCGFIAFVGRPNVGKSTLTNALIGSKISIVSRKAQTTRHRIHGVLTRDHEQFVFVDTPGFQTRHGGAMNRMMNRVVTQALAEVDVVVHVVEAGKWSSGDAQLLPLLPKSGQTILAINKVDELKDKNAMFAYVGKIMAQFPYAAVVPVSALRGVQLENLLTEIGSRLPEGEAMFEADTLTDRPMRFIAAELVREKIFRLVGDELPYGCTVIIEQWEETDKGVRVAACVIVERESHRPILLGAGGAHMKRIASEARHDMTQLLDKPVHLEVYIKVRKGWSDREGALRDLGYE